MNKRSLLVVAVVCGMLSACKSTGAAYNPPGGIGTTGRATHIVVTDVVNNSVLTFAATANGSAAAPQKTLSGGATTLVQPEGVYVDTVHDRLYVGNYNSGSNGTISEYALPAEGNSAPISTLGGGSTTLEGPAGLAVDASGNIYVADYGAGMVDVFGAGTTTQAPARQISGSNTGMGYPSGLWLDSNGDIWVGNVVECILCSGPYYGVLEFGPTANGNVAPIDELTVNGIPMGVFVDRKKNVWVATVEGSAPTIQEFAAGSTSTSSPIVTISGSNTALQEPNGISVDGAGYVYVSDYEAKAVYVFAPGANGNVAPVQTIPAGSTSGIAGPIGVVAY